MDKYRNRSLDQLAQESPEFEFSPENPPQLETLREKVFLVHAMNAIPEDDCLHARARDNSDEHIWEDQGPPSFRPTLHLSMGELFKGGLEIGFSRDRMPYAVILPLAKVETQLLSISPNDTAVLGDIDLDESCILVLPNNASYHGKAKVVRYNPQTKNLRDVTEKLMQTKDAWQMHTDTFIDGPHSFASKTTIKDVDVGDQRFFEALLEAHPHLSYGSHFHSETGEAWRTGVTDYRIFSIIRSYSDSFQNQIPTAELSIWRNLIKHNLEILDASLTTANFTEDVIKVYQREKEELYYWLNIVDADLFAREHYGKTLTTAPEELWQEFRTARKDPQKIKAILEANQVFLDDVHNLNSNISDIADTLANMPQAEFGSFLTQNETSFNHDEKLNLIILHAVKRWLIIKSEQARAENLDAVINSAVQADPSTAILMLDELKIFLSHDCNRLDDALEIIRLPLFKSALSNVWHVEITDIANLADLLMVCPQTAKLFEAATEMTDVDDEAALQFVHELGFGTNNDSKTATEYTSFLEAEYAVSNRDDQQERVSQVLKDISTPLNTARDASKIAWGKKATYCEVIKMNSKNMTSFWKRVGLATEYRKKFPQDKKFWSSDLSLLDVYKMLKSELLKDSQV